jgi:sulfatase maturation enzyme AslB (radical SAM superfamily)
MSNSEWLYNIKQKLWPEECQRCRETESLGNDSIRVHAIRFHQQQTQPDYLVVGGVLDNVCNSACQFCSQELSTKIGSLHGKNFVMIDNSNKFWQLPLNRIVHLDINGGEPSASPNYRRLLQNLPPSVTSVRVNTNCGLIINELESIAASGVDVTVTVSFDGIGRVHDYVRWPIAWTRFEQNLSVYRSMPGIKLNHWTTVNALNVMDMDRIFEYMEHVQGNHSYALLHTPDVLSVRYRNRFTLAAKQSLSHSQSKALLPLIAVDRDNSQELDRFLQQQDQLRNIDHKDYYSEIFC